VKTRSAIPFAYKPRPGPGGVVLRLAFSWCLALLSVVCLGVSLRMAAASCQLIAPALRAITAGISIARSVLAGAGIHNPLELLRLS
jgi:hypothetical protein